MNNGEHSMNTDLDMSEIKPNEDEELNFVCQDLLYGSGCGTAGDTEGVCYVCKARCKDLYWCRQCVNAGGHENHVRYLHKCKRKDLEDILFIFYLFMTYSFKSAHNDWIKN